MVDRKARLSYYLSRAFYMETTRRHKHYLEVAKRMALQSNYGKLKHGAVLVKGNKIVNASCNKGGFCSFGQRFRERTMGTPTLHAELGCILNLDRSVTQGAFIFVVRVGHKGNFMISKPCSMCHAALEHVGVKRVYHTSENGKLEMYKI